MRVPERSEHLDASISVAPDSAESLPEVVEERADRVVIQASPKTRAALVLLDAYDAGWTAAVDGRELAVFPVFGFFRGVYLDPGQQTVVFEYRPKSVAIGSWISFGSAVGVFAAVLVERRRKHAR